MRENLTTKQFADGTPMRENIDYYLTLPSSGSGMYDTHYNYCTPTIYNRSILDNTPNSNDVPSGVQGICPKNWHIPSSAEWQILLDYVDAPYPSCGILSLCTGWRSLSTNNPSFTSGSCPFVTGFTNETGLSLGLSFVRTSAGNIYQEAHYIGTKQNDVTTSLYLYVTEYYGPRSGFSIQNNSQYVNVRCLRD